MNNFNNNLNSFKNINNINNINNQYFKKIIESKRKAQIDNSQFNRITGNNKYKQRQDLLSKNSNNINFKKYSYEPIRKNIKTNKTNKSVNKNEHFHRKNINIPNQNLLKTSGAQNMPYTNHYINLYEQDGKIPINAVKVLCRN